MKYESVIGLEIHTQLKTNTKAFCNCKVEFGQKPNTNICPVCMGHPGSLPVVNEKMIEYALLLGRATNSKINTKTKFDRKNYFYPDIPKNYQITQYDYPICYDGNLKIALAEDDFKNIGITRIHMEEDTGKVFHDKSDKNTLIDYNRAGVPLLEIVTEPDMRSPEEAYVFLNELKATLRYLGISEANMEKGELRVDVNVSIKEKSDDEFGTKVELKNMNSFKAVKEALEYEINRQIELIDEGNSDKINQETRMWLEDKSKTKIMRTKEEAADYRYFPEPDIPAFHISEEIIEEVDSIGFELPLEKKERFKKDYELSDYDASILTSEIDIAHYFENVVKIYEDGKTAANWIINELLNLMNEDNKSINEIKVSSKKLAKILKLINDDKISGKIGKKLLKEVYKTGKNPEKIVEEKGWSQVSDSSKLEYIIEEVLEENSDAVERYRNGEDKLFGFFMGQVMKKTRGNANPQKTNEILRKLLKK